VLQVTPNVWQVRVRYGFMNAPDIPKALRQCSHYGLVIDQLMLRGRFKKIAIIEK
jgi:K+ transporter